MYKNNMKLMFIIIAVLFLPKINFAQCSDAGICQIGGHSMDEKVERHYNFGLSYSFGKSKKVDDISYHSIKLSAAYKLFSQSSIQVILPYNSQSGPLGNNSGIGDLIISWTQSFELNEFSYLDLSLGGKFATGEDNANNLPQAYQSGLGSNDFLFGANYSIKNFNVGIGYQLAGGRNDNIQTKLQRGDDFILRSSYSFDFEEFSIKPQFLLIKRLGESSVVTPFGTYTDLPESDQTQLNLLTQLNYRIDEQLSISVEGAIPFLQRDVNVDGLTRSFSIGIGINYSL